MALYVLFENKNTFLFLFFICLLLNLQMCQIILPDPIYRKMILNNNHTIVKFQTQKFPNFEISFYHFEIFHKDLYINKATSFGER